VELWMTKEKRLNLNRGSRNDRNRKRIF